jgi:CBS domain-containing protein
MNFLKHIETITTNKKGINNFDNILETIKVKDIIEEQTNFDLIFVNDNDTVSKVLNIFKNHKIISTPVRNDQNKFIGIIDMLDLITFVSTKFDTPEILVTYSYEQMEQFANHPIKSLIDISGRNTWIEISYQSSLNDLMKILSKKSCHRVAVSNEQGDIVGMITQV